MGLRTVVVCYYSMPLVRKLAHHCHAFYVVSHRSCLSTERPHGNGKGNWRLGRFVELRRSNCRDVLRTSIFARRIHVAARMKYTQIAASAADRQSWGRCLRGYQGALGTGSRIDPDCRDIGVVGHLDFYVPVEEVELRAAWQGSNLSTEHPNSMWHSIHDYPFLKINMTGYKFRRGFLKSDAWLGPLRFFFSKTEHGINKQVDVGYLAATSPVGLFSLFDNWRVGTYPPSFDMDETIKRAV